jgi:Arc/MetJ-type ribon-helix-helix transcriptional regulator
VFGDKIKISKELMSRIKEAVETAGYSSVDEFIETALERELDRIAGSKSPDSEEAVRKQLQGLGYID